MSAALFAAAIVRQFTGWWWLAAAIGKLRAWPGLRTDLVSSFGIAAPLAAVLAPALVAVELAAAAMVLGLAPDAGMLLSFVLMATFTAVAGYQFQARASVRCSCFGASTRPLSGFDLLRNGLVLLLIGAWLGALPAGSLPVGETLLAAAFGVLLCVAAVNFHDIAVTAGTA